MDIKRKDSSNEKMYDERKICLQHAKMFLTIQSPLQGETLSLDGITDLGVKFQLTRLFGMLELSARPSVATGTLGYTRSRCE